jgi:uncharacterized damage-inducible protein DinB
MVVHGYEVHAPAIRPCALGSWTGVEVTMQRLSQVYEGWDGYQTSLVRAIAPLTSAQLQWKPALDRRAIGELVRHISLGRINWFSRMPAPGIEEAMARVPEWFTDRDGVRHIVETAVGADDARQLVEWLELTWKPVQRVLDEWTIDDLSKSYRHRFRGVDYAVSRQWTIWRIMAHDIHHGGMIAMLLALQGIEAFELRGLGGHITEPARADQASS